MAKLTIGFGAVLAIVGVVVFALTGSIHYTALIPSWFGLAFVVCGALASTPDPKKCMLWMHIAVTVGLLGWVFPLVRVLRHPGMEQAAKVEHWIMVGLCALFTGLCVRSFVAARVARAA